MFRRYHRGLAVRGSSGGEDDPRSVRNTGRSLFDSDRRFRFTDNGGIFMRSPQTPPESIDKVVQPRAPRTLSIRSTPLSSCDTAAHDAANQSVPRARTLKLAHALLQGFDFPANCWKVTVNCWPIKRCRILRMGAWSNGAELPTN